MDFALSNDGTTPLLISSMETNGAQSPATVTIVVWDINNAYNMLRQMTSSPWGSYALKLITNTLVASNDDLDPYNVRLWDLTTGTSVAAYAISSQAVNSNGLTNQQGRGYFLDVFTSGYLVRAARGSSVLAVFDQTNGAVYASKTIAYATTSPIRSLAVIGTNS